VALSELSELAVVAPQNRLLSQRGLQALAPLKSLRWGGEALRRWGGSSSCHLAYCCIAFLLLPVTFRSPPLPTQPNQPNQTTTLLPTNRNLTWQSDDLNAQGPILECFTRFTSLRSLALSCTRRTMVLAFGEDYSAAFRAACPYVDLVMKG